MAIGRTFKEALQKGLRSLEIGRYGLGADGKDFIESEGVKPTKSEIQQKLAIPNSKRIFYLRLALKAGLTVEDIFGLTKIDPWFIYQLKQIVEMEQRLEQDAEVIRALTRDPVPEEPEGHPGYELLNRAKSWGFSDVQLAHLCGVD